MCIDWKYMHALWWDNIFTHTEQNTQRVKQNNKYLVEIFCAQYSDLNTSSACLLGIQWIENHHFMLPFFSFALMIYMFCTI